MNNKKKKKRGFSLLEVIVSIMVFSIISVALGVILNVGLKSWKDVDGKTEAERNLSRAVVDINNSIRNSCMGTIIHPTDPGIRCSAGTSSNPNGYIVCYSCARYQPLGTDTVSDDETVDNCSIFENELDVSINVDTSEEEVGSDSFDSNFNWNNFVVAYFVAKGDSCQSCSDIFGSGYTGICPHRYLVKKWYRGSGLPSNVSIPTLSAKWADTNITSLSSKKLSDIWTNTTKSSYDKILAKNVLAFGAIKSLYTVSYDIKIFKPNLNKSIPTSSDISDSVKAFYDSSKVDPIKDYCLQVSSTVAPLNTAY